MVELQALYIELKRIMKEFVRKELPQMQIYQVTDVSSQTSAGIITQFKVNIKHPNRGIQYNDVPMIGIGLGNLKGIISYPEKNDFVVVGWLGDQPVILGTINDYFTQDPDNIPQIKITETMIVSKTQGQYIYMKENGDITIVTPSGARLKLTNDGDAKLLDQDGYGFVVSGNDVIIYSDTVVTASGLGGELIPTTIKGSTTF